MNALLKLGQADPFEFTHRMSGGRHSAIHHSFFTTRQSRGMGLQHAHPVIFGVNE